MFISRIFLEKRTCCKCNSDDTNIRSCGSPRWYNEYDNKGNWTGRWLCHKCYSKSPNSTYGIQKSMAKCRMGQLSRYSKVGKGFIGEQIVAKVRHIDNCNIKTGNFHHKFDLLDPEYHRVQVEAVSLARGKWSFGFGHINKGSFDTAFLLCMDDNEPWIDVERLYIIPEEETFGRSTLAIIKDPSRTVWYEIFRADESPYNDAYHNMKLENCKVLKNEKIS